jgi:single-strand DNA-binding protein
MYQSTTIVGNVGRNPESKYTPDGKLITSFSVAISEGFGDKKHTLWFRVTTWGKTAEACQQYVGKGMRVLCEGRLQGDKETGAPRIWTGRDDNLPRTSFELTANTVRFLSPKKEKVESDSPYDEENSMVDGEGDELKDRL